MERARQAQTTRAVGEPASRTRMHYQLQGLPDRRVHRMHYLGVLEGPSAGSVY